MKRIVALFLSALLALGVLSVSAYAEENTKITERLSERMSQVSDDEVIEVFFDLRYSLSDYQTTLDIHDQTAQITGIDKENFQNSDEVSEYYRVWKYLMDQHMKTVVSDVMNHMGVSFEQASPDQTYFQYETEQCGVPTKYYLTKRQIEKAVSADEVLCADYFGSFKIDDSLRQKLDSLTEGEKADVYIYYNQSIITTYNTGEDAEQATRTAEEETGLSLKNKLTADERYRYDRVYYRVAQELRRAYINSIMEDMGVTAEDVIDPNYDAEKISFPKGFSLTEDQVNRMALSDYVYKLYSGEAPAPVLPQEKLSSTLAQKLENTDDDETTQVWMIMYPDYADAYEIDQRTNEIYGKLDKNATMEQTNAWRQGRNRVRYEDHKEKILTLLEDLGIDQSAILSEWDLGWTLYTPCHFNLTKGQIMKAVENQYVTSVDLYSGQDIPPLTYPITDIPEDKVITRLKLRANVISDEEKLEVWIENRIRIDSEKFNELIKETDARCGYQRDTAKTIVQVIRWMNDFRQRYHSYSHERAVSLLHQLGISEDDIVSDWDPENIQSVMPNRFTLTKSQLSDIASKVKDISEIAYLDLYAEQDEYTIEPWDDPVEDWISENASFSLTYIRGDADGDDTVSVLDATRIQKKLASLVEDSDALIAQNGDVDGDGAVSILDATAIQKKLAGYENQWKIGETVRISVDPSALDQ